MNWELEYLELLAYVAECGFGAPSRVGNTTAINGASLTVELKEAEFPLLTTRRVYPTGVLAELQCFLKGTEANLDFVNAGCKYWTDNARAWKWNIQYTTDDDLWLGRIYGAQWRNFNSQGIDQIAQVRSAIKADPNSRRHVVTAWNPAELGDMCLPPCHTMFQFLHRRGNLDCIVTMRSVDLCLGLPSDIILYYTLMILMARDTNLEPGRLVFQFGSAHIYEKHFESMKKQMLQPILLPPKYRLANAPAVGYLDSFQAVDLQFEGYNHSQEKISYELLT